MVTGLPEARNFVLLASLLLVPKTVPRLVRCSISICRMESGVHPEVGWQLDFNLSLCVPELEPSQLRWA